MTDDRGRAGEGIAHAHRAQKDVALSNLNLFHV